MGQKCYKSTAYDLPLQKRVFSVKRHFALEWSVNIESAANVCGSGALQAAITVIPLL
jgi:hypothetical protein